MANTLGNIGRALVEQGAALGWGDEAEAWLRSKLGEGSYEENLKDIAKSYGEFSKEHPVLAPSLEFTGGVAPAVASYLIPGAQVSAPASTVRAVSALGKIAENPVLRGIVTGSGTGAVASAGAANPDDRSGAAVSGLISGGVLGGLVPSGMRVGSAAKQLWNERINPTDEFIQNRALGELSDRLSSSGLSPKDLESKLAADRLAGVPSMVGNVSQPLARLTETLANRSGAGADKIEKAIEEQILGGRQRVYGQVSKALKPKDYYAYEDQLVNSLRNKARGLYDTAYAHGEVNDPRINAILEHPQFKGFYDEARRIADTEALGAKMRGEDPSKFELKDIYKVDPEGNVVKTQNPDVRTLDYIKRGIDSAIESAYRGTGMSTAQASALRDLRKDFVNALDENVPAYKQARSQYAGEMEVQDALRSGKNDFNKLSQEEIKKLTDKMSDSEKEAFKSGVARNLYGQIMDPSNNMNAAKKIINAPSMQEKLEPLFDNHGQYRLFKHSLERESELFNQAQQILRGSPTARRIQSKEAFEAGDEKAAMLAEMLTGRFSSSLPNLVKTAISNTAMSDKTANKLADMLIDKDPHSVAATVKLLEDYASRTPTVVPSLSLGEKSGITGAVAAFEPSPENLEKRNVNEMPSTNVPSRDIEAYLKTLK